MKENDEFKIRFLSFVPSLLSVSGRSWYNSLRGMLRLVRPSVRPSVRPPPTPSLTSLARLDLLRHGLVDSLSLGRSLAQRRKVRPRSMNGLGNLDLEEEDGGRDLIVRALQLPSPFVRPSMELCVCGDQVVLLLRPRPRKNDDDDDETPFRTCGSLNE